MALQPGTASVWGGSVDADAISRLNSFTPVSSPMQDLGMESTSLDDVLYRYASFRNLVDPITHDLLISLARYIHCPKPVSFPPVLGIASGLVKPCRGGKRNWWDGSVPKALWQIAVDGRAASQPCLVSCLSPPLEIQTPPLAGFRWCRTRALGLRS